MGCRVRFRRVCLLMVVVGAALLSGCGERQRLGPPGDNGTVDFKVGAESRYAIPPGANATVADTLSHRTFRFPEGGTGDLSVARILGGPVAPFPGEGFQVSYAGTEPVQVVVPDVPGGRPMVMGYGIVDGMFDDHPASTERWIAVPQVDTLESGIAFLLTLPFDWPGSSGRPAMLAGPPARRGFNNYWFSSIPAGSDEATHRMHIELQARTYIDGFLDSLDTARQTAARAAVAGRMRPNYEYDGLFYNGFWWRSLGAAGRLLHPAIHLRLDANAGNIAHETGHYLVHVLVGDDVQSTLEGQQPLWDTEHGTGDPIGRERIADDYAFVVEWFLTGGIKAVDPLDPYSVFMGRTPLTVDYPGLEGFAAVLLAGLTRQEPRVRDIITGRFVDAPDPALGYDELFEIIARGATDVGHLRENIAAQLGPDADLLPAVAQRCGWRYYVRGRFVDGSGGPVAGILPSSFYRVDGTTYEGGSSVVPSGADGHFAIVGDVFPGDSWIRGVDAGDTVNVAIRIDWDLPTNQAVSLPDLVVSFPPVIEALSTDHGKAGDPVTITGRRFGASQVGSTVRFNGTPAPVASWTSNSIAVTVPPGASSGDVVVTVGAAPSRGKPFTVEGGGRWVLEQILNLDYQPQNGTWLNINEFEPGNSGFHIRTGYDNPNFTERHYLDWETTVDGSWTPLPVEMLPGGTFDETVTLTTQLILLDDPPTESDKSRGWLSMSGWGLSPVIGQGTSTFHVDIPASPTWGVPDSSRVVMWIQAGGYSGGTFGGGHAGGMQRKYTYRYHSN